METWDYAWVSIITSVFDEKCWWCLIVHSFGPIPRSTSGLLQWRQMAAPFFSLLSPFNILSHHHLGQLQLDNIVTRIYHMTNFAVIVESSSWLSSSQWCQMAAHFFSPLQHIITSFTSIVIIKDYKMFCCVYHIVLTSLDLFMVVIEWSALSSSCLSFIVTMCISITMSAQYRKYIHTCHRFWLFWL